MVGDKTTEPTIRKALAIGADDAVRVDAHRRSYSCSQLKEIAKT